jgi:hypothetical protein
LSDCVFALSLLNFQFWSRQQIRKPRFAEGTNVSSLLARTAHPDRKAAIGVSVTDAALQRIDLGKNSPQRGKNSNQ